MLAQPAARVALRLGEEEGRASEAPLGTGIRPRRLRVPRPASRERPSAGSSGGAPRRIEVSNLPSSAQSDRATATAAGASRPGRAPPRRTRSAPRARPRAAGAPASIRRLPERRAAPPPGGAAGTRSPAGGAASPAPTPPRPAPARPPASRAARHRRRGPGRSRPRSRDRRRSPRPGRGSPTAGAARSSSATSATTRSARIAIQGAPSLDPRLEQ